MGCHRALGGRGQRYSQTSCSAQGLTPGSQGPVHPKCHAKAPKLNNSFVIFSLFMVGDFNLQGGNACSTALPICHLLAPELVPTHLSSVNKRNKMPGCQGICSHSHTPHQRLAGTRTGASNSQSTRTSVCTLTPAGRTLCGSRQGTGRVTLRHFQWGDAQMGNGVCGCFLDLFKFSVRTISENSSSVKPRGEAVKYRAE